MRAEQKSEQLKKSLQKMVLRENTKGLSAQDKYVKNKMLREMFGHHAHGGKG